MLDYADFQRNQEIVRIIALNQIINPDTLKQRVPKFVDSLKFWEAWMNRLCLVLNWRSDVREGGRE